MKISNSFFYIISLTLTFNTAQAQELQSTSPYPQEAAAFSPASLLAEPSDEPKPITFSEFPIGTTISFQYKDKGVIFINSSTFITTDGANPTSPVLSGKPTFFGPITAQFVDPLAEGFVPTSVEKFSFDAGYFDELGTVRVVWFDKEGKKLGQIVNSKLGIQRIESEPGDISRFTIEAFAEEPAGFAIDNLKIYPVGPSMLFREATGDSKVFWNNSFFRNRAKDLVPGLDHVGFQYENSVYESHPGYPSGTYISADGQEQRSIVSISGAQGQHSRKTFIHNSQNSGSPVVQLREVPLPREVAAKMKAAVDARGGLSYREFTFSTAKISETLSPAAQKGQIDNSATCVGYLEGIAESAGVNGGEGFVKNSWESITVPYPVPGEDIPMFPLPTDVVGVKTIELPLLSPQLMYEGARGGLGAINFDFPLAVGAIVKNWLQGFFDPVDFMITDPLGRRLGHTEATGTVNEIPGGFFSGNGDLEQFLIPNPLPGEYKVQLVGLGGAMNAAVGTADSGFFTEKDMAANTAEEKIITVLPKENSPGDIDGDGDIDQDDLNKLKLKIPRFATSTNDPADLNRDGEVNEKDLELLTALIAQIAGINSATCQTVDLTKIVAPFEKSYKAAVRAQKAVQRLAKKDATSAKAKKALKKAKADSAALTEAVFSSCSKIPKQVLDCGDRIKAGCHVIDLRGVNAKCEDDIRKSLALSSKQLGRLGQSFTRSSKESVANAIGKAKKSLKKQSLSTIPASHSVCQ